MAFYRSEISAFRTNRIDLLVKSLAWQSNLRLEIERDTTLLREHVRFLVSGSKLDIERFKDRLSSAVDKHNSGD